MLISSTGRIYIVCDYLREAVLRPNSSVNLKSIFKSGER